MISVRLCQGPFKVTLFHSRFKVDKEAMIGEEFPSLSLSDRGATLHSGCSIGSAQRYFGP